MAERPIFLPATSANQVVTEIQVAFSWNPGFAAVQKKKNVQALHEAAAKKCLSPLLEVSTKSGEKLGQRLSAFNIKVHTKDYGDISLECAYQGSKVFERGGPFTDIYGMDARSAKQDPRLRSSGAIIAFDFEGVSFPITPKTAFYDWLFFKTLFPHREWLKKMNRYVGFTDIEFNPERSINCQARSCATFMTLLARDQLDECAESPVRFIELLTKGLARSNTDFFG